MEQVMGIGFVCGECGQSYSRAEYLRRHERKHSAARPFQCEDCPKSFGRSDVLLRHRRRCHPQEAALTEPVKPVPSLGPKKPSRPRNRNAMRPYPAPHITHGKDNARQTSVDSDPEYDATDASLPTTAPVGGIADNHTQNQSIPVGLPTDNSSGGIRPAGDFGDTIRPLEIPRSPSPDVLGTIQAGLPWAALDQFTTTIQDPPYPAPHLSSPSSSNDSSAPLFSSPFLAEADHGPFVQSLDSSMTSISSMSTGQGSLDQPSLATGSTSGSSSSPRSGMSYLELGASMWAVSLENGPAFKNQSPNHLVQFGSWYAFPPISPEEDIANMTFNDDFTAPPGFVSTQEMEDALLGIARGERDASPVIDHLLNNEGTMITSEMRLLKSMAGPEELLSDPAHKFHLPHGLFQGCYSVPHWLLPPRHRLAVFASNTFRLVLGHLGNVHEPTFKLSEVHPWLAFSMCTAAAHKATQHRRIRGTAGEEEPWDAVQSVVRTEKTGMFVKVFSQVHLRVPRDDMFAALQGMLIYNSASFLANDPQERLLGESLTNAISKISKRCGMFDPEAEFMSTVFDLTANPLEEWKKFIRNESRRRTSWLVYIIDTVSSMETASTPLIFPRDTRQMPLPVPEPVWKASSSHDWIACISSSPGLPITLEFAMERLFDIPINATGPEPDNFLDIMELGLFARLCMIVTLLRGILEYGAGKPRGGYVVQRWILNHPGENATGPTLIYDGHSPEFNAQIIAIFQLVLERWKKSWDLDSLFALNREGTTSTTDARPFIHDGLPYWWMCHLLLNQLTDTTDAAPPANREDWEYDEGLNRLKGVDVTKLFLTAKDLARSSDTATL